MLLHRLVGVQIEPPPFRDVPSQGNMTLLELKTDEGLSGWAVVGSPHSALASLLSSLKDEVIGLDPIRVRRMHLLLGDTHRGKRFGRSLQGSLAAVDIALWDLAGKALGRPSHHLMGGAADEVGVYVTFGAPSGTIYSGRRYYETDELVREARHLVESGIGRFKVPVGRLDTPDPYHDHERLVALRDALGPDVTIALDAASRFTLSEAKTLCRLVEDLRIDFFEEPILFNDPALLRELRASTTVPIAAAPTDRISARDLLEAEAVDVLQPNAVNDGGYTLALDIAALARAFNKPIGHGNGTGPHNIALQAAVSERGLVEYHYHWWKLYNAVFVDVPQPINNRLTVSIAAGLGLEPRPDVLAKATSS